MDQKYCFDMSKSNTCTSVSTDVNQLTLRRNLQNSVRQFTDVPSFSFLLKKIDKITIFVYRSTRRNILNVSQIRNALEDLLSDSDNGGVSDDSVADTSYFPQTLQESSDDSDDGDDGDKAEDGGDVRELPDIPEDIPMDMEAVPGPSHGGGGDRAPLLPVLRYNQPSKKRRVTGKR